MGKSLRALALPGGGSETLGKTLITGRIVVLILRYQKGIIFMALMFRTTRVRLTGSRLNR